jgi:putative ABC transport system permease protein
VLAATGLYGVLAFGVTRRLREFGIRIALGARAGHVVEVVLRQSFLLVAIGLAIGVAGAVIAGRLISEFLFGGSTDALVIAVVALVLFLVALLASAIPARRGAAADPMVSLRAE